MEIQFPSVLVCVGVCWWRGVGVRWCALVCVGGVVFVWQNDRFVIALGRISVDLI